MPPTHEVVNQVPPLTGYDVADDPAMLDAPRREGAGWAEASDPAQAEARARRLTEALAVVLQGSLLVRYGGPAVADAFAVSRLGGDWGGAFGTLPAGVDTGTIIKRVTPVLPPT